LKLCILGSGSRGNCTYIENRGFAILIDQGFSYKQLQERFDSQKIDPGNIRAILVTHEHEDHISGVGIAARKLDVPVYGTPGTLSAKPRIFNGGEKLAPIESGIPFTLGPFDIHSFSVSHDAADPVQYCITSGEKKISIATDLGFVSMLVEERLRNSDLVVIEANHDIDMLMKGTYTWELKQRIMSKRGHLSNANAAKLVFNLSQGKTQRIVLAHLSEENNTAELAEQAIRDIFERFDRRLRSLIVARQNEATCIIEV
jgi:phosphoribosyl 1,2-cyclic phosphodiesterase